MINRILTKRQLQKKATLFRKKEERKIERAIKKSKKQTYQDFVKIIKERDNYCCAVCGKNFKEAKPQALQMAHILSKENYPDLMLNPMNVLCLCFYHHKNAPISSHLDGFVFVEFFKNKFSDRYDYLLNYLKENKR